MKKVVLLLIVLSLLLYGCQQVEVPCDTDEECIPEEPLVGVKYICVKNVCMTRPLGNPATEFCLDKGYITESRIQVDGGQYSLCKFPDGNECEEWMYFRDECSPGRVTVKIDNLRFMPEELNVKTGTTVTWENFEDKPHQIINEQVGDYSKADMFDSERIEQGGEFSYTFDEKGEYKYSCLIHPNMKGKIIVS